MKGKKMSEQTQAVMWYAVKKYLDGELNDDRWQYTVDENEANTFFHGYQVIDGEVLKDVKFGFYVSDYVVVCYSDFQMYVPENAKSKVAEYIIRANHHDLHGAFDMIYDDGCIRYKILLSVNDLLNDSFAEANLSKARLVSMMAWQKHIENLFRLINGKTGNKSVVQLIEGC